MQFTFVSYISVAPIINNCTIASGYISLFKTNKQMETKTKKQPTKKTSKKNPEFCGCCISHTNRTSPVKFTKKQISGGIQDLADRRLKFWSPVWQAKSLLFCFTFLHLLCMAYSGFKLLETKIFFFFISGKPKGES